MKINFHRQIQAYEDQKVNLSEAVRQDLYAKREANRNRLKVNLPERIKIKDFIAQGSMAIRTTVQEADGNYDIDDGVAFYAETLKGAIIGFFDLDSDEVREMVCEALKDDKFSKQPEIIGNCVRVYYAEGYHVDVPSFRVNDAGTSEESQELAGKDGWRSSDPTQINVWFEARVQKLNFIQEDSGSQFRRTVRLLKRFARSRGNKWNMPNGLKLTMLADECFERSAERDDKAFYFLLENMNQRLNANLVVYNRAQNRSERNELTKTESDDNMVELRQHIAEALRRLAVLLDEHATHENVREAWEWVFQSNGFFRDFERSTGIGVNGSDVTHQPMNR